jgi:glycosyltransferase involved in cell wall biosynthesis
MRIAHVAPPSGRTASGILTVLEELTVSLSQRGHHVELWHHDDWTAPSLERLLERLQHAGVSSRRLRASTHRRPILSGLVLPPRDAADVVHLHSVFVPLNTATARRWPGVVVLSPHGGYDPHSLRRSSLRKRAYSAMFEKQMLRSADVVFALTTVEAEQIRGFAGRVVTEVVPNGVRQQFSIPSAATFRRALEIPADERLAVFVGRLDVLHKGLDRLVRSMKQAPSWRVALVGPDFRHNEDLLRRMADREGVSRQVMFLGSLSGEELGAAYAGADLFVLASRWEGLPMSLLEALSWGTPALVSEEVERLVGVSDHDAGWVAAPDQFGATLERLTHLSHDAWAQRSRAARCLAREYAWDTVAARCEQVYRAAIQNRADHLGQQRDLG